MSGRSSSDAPASDANSRPGHADQWPGTLPSVIRQPADVAPEQASSVVVRDGAEPGSAGVGQVPTSADRNGLWLSRAAAIGAAIVALVWITAAVRTAGHGLDISDESYYLLSYRWWDTNLYTYTGAQYFYGPVFELLGYDIAGLRVFRLLTVVGTHAVFGWTFMRWLRERRPAAPSSRWWEAAGTAVIVASGGMVYCWLPLSPGYNDVSLLGSLLAAAVALRIARDTERGAPVPLWVPALFGPITVVMLLSKWASSALSLAVVAVAVVVVAAPRGRRELLRIVTAAAGGTLLSVLVVHLFVVPLSAALPPMLAINRTVASGTNSPMMLLQMYYDNVVVLLKQVARGHGVLLLAAAVAPFARSRRSRWGAFGLIVVGLALSIRRVVRNDELLGGTVNLDRFPIVVTAAIAVAIVLAVAVLIQERISRGRAAEPLSSLTRRDGRGWVVLGMLAMLPLTQAAGTGNPVHFLAIVGLGAWVALVIAVVTGIEAATAPARVLAGLAAAGAVVCTMFIATDGLWDHPYRTAGYNQTTAEAPGVPALSSLRLDPLAAAQYASLYASLAPYLEPPGRAIMAFDEMPGMVLMLGGRPVGEAWYSAIDHERSAAGIRQACTTSPPWWGSRTPILIFSRAVTETEIAALRSCGLTFATDYRLLGPVEPTHGLQVYIPTNAAEGQR